MDYLPIVYGSVAIGLGKTEDGTTHRWTIYIRSGEDSGLDLSSVVGKVVFKLHPTCDSPVVECTQAPFETTQPGWGEFPALIEMTFKDESKISFTHQLRLHPAPGQSLTKPVVHEVYDEVVFANPLPEFKERLRTLPKSTVVNALTPYFKTFDDKEDVIAIQKAHAYIKQELEKVLIQYGQIKTDVDELKLKIARARAGGRGGAETNQDTTATATITNGIDHDLMYVDAVLDVTTNGGDQKRVKLEN